ncbi:MAG TPA: SMC family ATPase, partial [Acidimicrobiales bacterium]|nr:SMC family ATPase [Acidimicrobiales bacterium]
MRITRLHLRNYRVYEDPVDLEIPPGLVGIYGPNGSGKSLLVESIRWTLYGRARTANDEVRTADVKADCITEVEFEHEGHLYVVRRVISGAGAHVKASADSDGFQVADGVRDTTRYVHSILGMDDAAFRASVFAEQKQLAAFSQQAPGERRRLVLQLLGITPLDAARDRARKDARESQETYERLRSVLPDVEVLRGELKALEEAAVDAAATSTQHDAEAEAAQSRLEVVRRRHEEVDVLRQEHDRLVAEAKAATADHDRSVATVAKLASELAELTEAAERLVVLEPEAEGWREAESQLRLMEAVVSAQQSLAAITVIPEPPIPDEDGCEAARALADTARARLAAVEGRIAGARAELDRARQATARSAELTGEGDCPLCGQALGGAFEKVQEHRAAELAEAEARVATLVTEQATLAAAATDALQRSRTLVRELKEAREGWQVFQKAHERRAGAEKALHEAELAFGRPLVGDERAVLSAEVDRRRRAADESNRLRGRLERREVVAAELDIERVMIVEHEERLALLAEKTAGLGFRPDDLTQARRARDEAQLAVETGAKLAEASRLAVSQAQARVEGQAQRVVDAAAQHAQLADLGEDARHLGRVAELLNAFRNNQVSAVGPRLTNHA